MNLVIQVSALIAMTVLSWYEVARLIRRNFPSIKAVSVHLWKDAEERKNARGHKDFGHCENSETVFALAKL